MKIHNKGQVVIPASLRKKYHLDIGDEVDVEFDEKGIHLYPVVEEQINLQGVLKEEQKKYGFPSEDEIQKATGKGMAKK